MKSSRGLEYLERIYAALARRVTNAASKIINGDDAIRLTVFNLSQPPYEHTLLGILRQFEPNRCRARKIPASSRNLRQSGYENARVIHFSSNQKSCGCHRHRHRERHALLRLSCIAFSLVLGTSLGRITALVHSCSGRRSHANTPPGMIPYPLPAALVALPFAPFPADLAAALFFGISSGLLALGLVRHSPQRLFIFLAYPYWSALITAQWPPLIMCGAFFPLALVFCVAKPQTGTPMALAHLSRQELIAASALLLASLILMPRWPLEWIPN